MNKKEIERLEEAHYAKMRSFDEMEWDLYDLRQATQRVFDGKQAIFQDIQQNTPDLNLINYLAEVEDSYDDFIHRIRLAEDDLEEARYEERREFNQKLERQNG